MVQRQLTLATLACCCILGCGSSEPEVKADPPEAQAAVQQSANTAWTQERQEAYRNALRRAKTGEEGGTVVAPGAQTNYGSKSPGMPSDNPDAGPAEGGGGASPYGQSPTTSAPQSSGGIGRPQDEGSTGSDPMVGK